MGKLFFSFSHLTLMSTYILHILLPNFVSHEDILYMSSYLLTLMSITHHVLLPYVSLEYILHVLLSFVSLRTFSMFTFLRSLMNSSFPVSLFFGLSQVHPPYPPSFGLSLVHPPCSPSFGLSLVHPPCSSSFSHS